VSVALLIEKSESLLEVVILGGKDESIIEYI
jgi:hypothetical protein